MSVKSLINKIPISLLSTYGRSLLELVDFVKDLSYVVTVQHQNENILLLLWIFALFAIVQTITSILIMTKTQYIDHFGSDDLKDMSNRTIGYYLQFIKIKIIRIIKEAF